MKYVRAIRRMNVRFDLAVQGSHAGIYDWDIKTGHITHNPIVNRILGYDEAEEIDLSLDSFLARLHPEDAARVGEAVQLHLATGAPYETEFRLKRKDGSYVWVTDSALAMRNRKGEPILWAGTMVNIDEKKRFEEHIIRQNEELRNTNAHLDFLIHKLSHDIKAPLASIIGLIGLMNMVEDSREIKSHARMVDERVKDLDAYVLEVIEYSRSSRSEPKLEKVMVIDLIMKAVKSVSFLSSSNHVELIVNVADDFEVVTDRIMIGAILGNLVTNAVKYFDAGKRERWARVSCIRSETEWTLIVEDNGMGICEKHHSKIFDMFYRVSSNLKGSGLGLFIVKESVKKLNGIMSFHSELGRGTRFEISFPLLQL